MKRLNIFIAFFLVLAQSTNLVAQTTDFLQVIVYGQSLSMGWQSKRAITTEALDNNFMVGSNVITLYNDGATTLNPLVATRWSKGGEQPVVSCVNSFSKAYRENINANQKFIATTGGEGGRTIERLSKECTNDGYYESTFIKSLDNTLAAIDSETVACSAIIYMQGEYNAVASAARNQGLTPGTNGTQNKSEYKALLLKLKNNMQADIMSKYGQVEKPLFFIYQTSGSYVRIKELPIVMAQIEFAQENSDVILLNPHYAMSDYGGGHLSTNGYRWYGEVMAKSLIEKIVYNKTPETLKVKSFNVSENKITIDYDVPTPPLVLDTWTSAKVMNYGFTVYEKGRVIAIDTVKIINSNQVELTCANTLSEYIEVVYAGEPTDGAGNLRDSDSTSSMYTYFDDSGDSQQETYTPTTENGASIYGQPYGLQNWSDAFYHNLGNSCDGVDAFTTIEAEMYCDMSGIRTQVSSDGGSQVAYIQSGSWIKFNNVDFRNGAASFNARVSTETTGGVIELRLGSTSGTLIGKCPIESTGSWTSYATKSCHVKDTSGVHDLYLMFTGGSGYLFNINWFEFSHDTVILSNNATITSNTYTISESSKTITKIDFDENLTSFKSYLVPAYGASFEVYQSDETTIATDLATGYKVVVIAENGTSKSVYTITLDEDPISAIDATFEHKIHIYPNPVKQWLHFKNIDAELAAIEIFDVAGSKILASQLSSANSTIDVSRLLPGVYFIVITENGLIARLKVVKQ